jgi:predicted O-linked N-acetylglucosamine transferase (SPINDLY family)
MAEPVPTSPEHALATRVVVPVPSTDQIFQQAVAALNARQLADAGRLFRRVLGAQPNHVGALNLLTAVLMNEGRFSEAETFIARAVALGGASDISHYNYGLILKQLNRPADALQQFSQAAAVNPTVSETFNNRGTVFNALGQYEKAISDFDRAIALDPKSAAALCNKGNTLAKMKRHGEALASYDEALAREPGLIAARLGRGNVLTELKRYDEALKAYDGASGKGTDLGEAWVGRGNVFYSLKRHDEALAAYDKALALEPALSAAWLGRGNVLAYLFSFREALPAYDKALVLAPELTAAWVGRGDVFFRLKEYDKALANYDEALARDENLAKAWFGRGCVLTARGRYGEAFAALDKAFALDAELDGLQGVRLHNKIRICDWADFIQDVDHQIKSVRDKKIPNPLSFLAISTSPEDQLIAARSWLSTSFPQRQTVHGTMADCRHDRIHVGYVSADFHQHAVAFLAAGMFECHDRSRFVVTAISLGPRDESEMRRRLERSFDRFVDASVLSDAALLSLIEEAEIDILVDLNGFTDGARTRIFAARPAPIQVGYLGYPGTMGADFIDYLICDRVLVPETSRQHYSEKLVYLPHSYQINDAKREISERKISRLDCDLPENGFVFCCFNRNFKINPETFDCWMGLLRQVDGAVLWLFEDNPTATTNLRKEAAARGIDATRLVFAKQLPIAEHLARHRLADLFLDTMPYNAHTTASDALWSDLPVLTQVGETFAARVAASLLNAVGLPELIATTRDEYEGLALALARDPARLAALKAKLMRNRLTTPLFNTEMTTRHIERAYQEMYERHRCGLPPDDIEVACLSDLVRAHVDPGV